MVILLLMLLCVLIFTGAAASKYGAGLPIIAFLGLMSVVLIASHKRQENPFVTVDSVYKETRLLLMQFSVNLFIWFSMAFGYVRLSDQIEDVPNKRFIDGTPTVEGAAPNPEGVDVWADSIYYASIVHTTVGYGDILPRKAQSRALTLVHCMTSFMLWTSNIFAYYSEWSLDETNVLRVRWGTALAECHDRDVENGFTTEQIAHLFQGKDSCPAQLPSGVSALLRRTSQVTYYEPEATECELSMCCHFGSVECILLLLRPKEFEYSKCSLNCNYDEILVPDEGDKLLKFGRLITGKRGLRCPKSAQVMPHTEIMRLAALELIGRCSDKDNQESMRKALNDIYAVGDVCGVIESVCHTIE